VGKLTRQNGSVELGLLVTGFGGRETSQFQTSDAGCISSPPQLWPDFDTLRS